MARKRLLIISGIIVGVMAIGTGVAFASIPDSSGVVHACYKTPVPAHGNPLVVIDTMSGGSCGSGYAPLNWNQAGPQGPSGPAGVSGYEIIQASVTVPAHSSGQADPECPSGKVAISGGYYLGSNPPAANMFVRKSAVYVRSPGVYDWEVVVDNNNDSGYTVTADAYCVYAN